MTLTWISNDTAATLFWAASRLTDPPCEVDRAYKEYLVSQKVNDAAGVAIHAIEIAFYAALSLFTALPGMLFRAAALNLQKTPYLEYKGTATEKTVTDGKVSTFFWNPCAVGGGFTISDGGVIPFPRRINEVAQAIIGQDADVVTLCEMMDTATSFALYEKLKGKYIHFYFNIGPQTMGPNSGLFVASRVSIDDLNFTPFPKDHLDGRSKGAEKGFVSFTAAKVAKIFATHLGHSEICGAPTPNEVKARQDQISDIMPEIRKSKELPTILMGDLNLDFAEFQQQNWHKEFALIEEHPTWGGDKWCADLSAKPPSEPCMYDYVLHYKNDHGSISAPTYLETGYDPTQYLTTALSDHKGVRTTITSG